MIKSKRLIVFIIIMLIFLTLLFTTEYKPVEIATGLTMIGGTYQIAETARKSEK